MRYPTVPSLRMRRLFPVLFVSLLAIGAFFDAPTAEAGPKGKSRPSLHRTLRGPQSFFTTNRYRPRIRFEAGAAKGGRLPLVAEFSTQAGYIDRIEVRLDGEVIGTVRPEKNVSSGRLETAIDLAKVPPGEHKLKLWVWQGRQGYRRFHGESKSFRFTR